MRTKWTRLAVRAAARNSVRCSCLALAPCAECSRTRLPLRATSARVPIPQALLPRLALRGNPARSLGAVRRELDGSARISASATQLVARAARATAGTTRRDAVPLFAHGGSGEASPVSAGRAQCNAAGSIGSIGRAVARRTPGRLEAVDSNASKRSIQTPRSGRFKRLGAVNANVNEGVVGRVVRGPGRRRRTADRTGSRGPSRAEGRVHRARRGAPRRCDRGTNGHDRS